MVLSEKFMGSHHDPEGDKDWETNTALTHQNASRWAEQFAKTTRFWRARRFQSCNARYSSSEVWTSRNGVIQQASVSNVSEENRIVKGSFENAEGEALLGFAGCRGLQIGCIVAIPVQFTAGSGCDSTGLLTRTLFRARSLSAVSEVPTSEELGVERLCRGRFRYSDLKEAAPWDYGICIWMSRS
jgi:hypothetical protein